MAHDEVRNAALGVGVDIDLARKHWLFAAGPQGRTRNPQSPPGAARLHSGPGVARGPRGCEGAESGTHPGPAPDQTTTLQGPPRITGGIQP
jgi:hypothetical protein